MAMELSCLSHTTASANGCRIVSQGMALRIQNRVPSTVCLAQVLKRHTSSETFYAQEICTSSLTKLKQPSQSRKRFNQVYAISAEKEKQADISVPPIPKSIHAISNGDHILGFGADLSEDHPGYYDNEYKKRRSYIADLAKIHRIKRSGALQSRPDAVNHDPHLGAHDGIGQGLSGEPIPCVDYSAEETRVWGLVLNTLVDLYPTHACKEYVDSYKLFNFKPDRIPQLQELSEVLEQTTGWHIRPVAGLLHPRDFLNGLAFRTFHSTQYVRHGSNPMYTPEPDICHEVLGHVPMLADPEFADLAWVIGQASLGASEKDIWHLTKLYWYTVEFGTVKEGNEIRAFGAGLLSSIGELKHMREGTDGVMPEFVELDPFKKMPKMSYKDGYQKKYFLCDGFADAATKLRSYSRSILKPEVKSMNFGGAPIQF